MASQSENCSVNITTEKESSPRWEKDIASKIRPTSKEMLVKYTGVPPDELVEHIDKTRKRAWEMGPYSCVGLLTWLNPYILLHEAHDTILSKLKNGATILDCGCFFSTDLRQLAYEGAPTDKMYGFDMKPEFFDIGFDFYDDRDRWQGTFFAANGLDELDASALGELKGKINIIWASKFIHLFPREKQVVVAARLVGLLKPVPGSLFCGSQNGLPEPQEILIRESTLVGMTSSFFLGNADTIKEMWNEVAELTGTTWNVESRLLDMRTIGMHQDDESVHSKRTGYNLQWTATLLEPPMS